MKAINKRYIIKNAAPPFFDAMTGKATMLPRPTAEPAAAKINPSLELNCPLDSATKTPCFQMIRLKTPILD